MGVSQRALRGSLRGLCGGLSEGSAGFSEGFGGSDPMLVTLGSCWKISNLFDFGPFRSNSVRFGRLLARGKRGSVTT